MKNTFINKKVKDMVSIILLSYNSGDYLLEAIDSVLSQDYPLIELIVTDDGSKKFDEDVLARYIESKRKNNVEYSVIHREKNIGTVKNINNALSVSRGEFIRILGGDDTYPIPDTLSKMVDLLKADNTIAVVGRLQQCNTKMVPIYDPRVEKSNKALPHVLKMEYSEGRKYIAKKDIFPIANQAVCYRREFFEYGGFCNEEYFLIEDIALANRVLAINKDVSYYDEFSVNHRAKVGISTSRELFAPSRLLYYKDCITYAEKDIASHPEIFGPIYRKEQERLSRFVYDMAKSKADGRGKLQQVLIMFSYTDTMIYYVFTNTRKFLRRIKDRIV